VTARPVSGPVAELARLRGVRGVLLTSLEDALPIESWAHVDVDVDVLAAFATALMRRSRQAASAAQGGAVRLVTLEAQRGRLLGAACGTLLLVVLGERESNPGLLRVRALRALEGLG
jgi:predicted regulator of Ras-like GTPase activity (Roadblock/LC7/MglB family)